MREHTKHNKVDGDSKVNTDNDGPSFRLHDSDKFFLAVAIKQAKNIAFVYSVYCAPMTGSCYSGFADTEIATFNNLQAADIYYQTICEGIKLNKELYPRAYQNFVELNKTILEKFNHKYK